METRSYLVCLLWLLRNRALNSQNKALALQLLLEMVCKAFAAAKAGVQVVGMIYKDIDAGLVSQELAFTPQGMTLHWHLLLQHSAGATTLWKRLTTTTWMGRCITTAIENASLSDIWLFSVYVWCHQKVKVGGRLIWNSFVSMLLPELIVAGAKCLVALAMELSQESLKSLPILKTKLGNIRKVCDPVNRLLLLRRLKGKKQRRSDIASTHPDLGGNTFSMIRYENYCDCLLHMKMLEKDFWKPQQVCVSWDPATYGGKELFIGVAYAHGWKRACYLLAQEMSPTMVSELRPDMYELAAKRKLARLDGFRELKGLNCALQSIGLSLKSFYVPEGLWCYPLEKHQHRLRGQGGEFFIADTLSGEVARQVPHTLDLGSIPCLLSISDQGPANTAALNYLAYSKNAILCYPTWDVYHRCWNDLKLSLKRSACKGWRVTLELSCVKNLSFGPFGSGSFFFKKKAALQDWLSKHDVSSPEWAKFQHLVAMERRELEPSTWEEKQNLFEALHQMRTFHNKGVCVKLMRWFSWFEAMGEMAGEFYLTKLVLSIGQALENENELEMPQTENHQRELQELKKRKGVWALAPSLIHERNLAVKDCIMCIGKAAWKRHSSRIRDIVMPEQVAEYNISCARDQAWCDELIETLFTALEDDNHLHHLWPEYLGHVDTLKWHMDLLSHLCHTRAMSLSVHHCLPPFMYAHMLSFDDRIATDAARQALQDWNALLKAEDALLGGVDVKPLHTMHWRLSPLVRSFFLAVEQDHAKGRVNSADSAGLRLQKLFTQHIGDSRICENIHQHGRDLFRGSKADSMSTTAIMANVLRSGVLESRNVETACFDQSKKVVSAWSSSRKEGVVKNMVTRGKSMPKEMEDLMLPKSKASGLNWPSPSPGSLFQSVCSSQWLFHYYRTEPSGQSVNSAWMSFLCQPGKIVAQKSTGLLLLVLASAEHAFLAVKLLVHIMADGSNAYRCQLDRDALRFHFVVELNDWVDVQAQPFLSGAGGTRGPVMWKRLCDEEGVPLQCMSLVGAALLNGHSVTYQQLKELAKVAFGLSIKGNPPLRDLQDQLIHLALSGQDVETAQQRLEQKCPQDDMDSNLSEVISELGQDESNMNDIKDLKAKKRHRKLKEAWALNEQIVQSKPAKAAKGLAKTKSKSKSSKKHQSLGNAFIKKAWQRLQEARSAQLAIPPLQDGPVDDGAAVPPAEPEGVAELQHDSEAVQSDGEVGGGSSAAAPADEVLEHQPSSSSKQGVKRPKEHRSPLELLQALAPPGCSLTIGHDDHRFKSIYPSKSKKLEGLGKLQQNHFSLSFAQKRTWSEALQEVHGHVWRKWQLIKHEHPLPAGATAQTPGDINAEILEKLDDYVKQMGPWTGPKKKKGLQ